MPEVVELRPRAVGEAPLLFRGQGGASVEGTDEAPLLFRSQGRPAPEAVLSRQQQAGEGRHAQEEVDVLAEELDLDDETTAAVVDELEDRHAAWSATRDDVRAGDLSWIDARREFQAIREASDATLVDLIGAEATEELNTRLFGERPGRGD